MISLDRGKYIREQNDYINLMNSCDSVIIDDFYKMSFKQIFHYKNLDIKNLYKEWKSSVKKWQGKYQLYYQILIAKNISNKQFDLF